jgi:hypothetical protein
MERKKKTDAYHRFNDWLGDKLAKGLSTMECFYIVFLLVVLVLLFGTPTTPLQWVTYIVQAFFQGVALLVLGYVGWKSGERAEKTINGTHRVVMEELKLVKEELRLAREERDEMREVLTALRDRAAN